jgi:hypothetical protein
MVKRRRPPQWHLLFTGVGLLAAMVVAVYVGGVPTAPIDDGPVRLHNLPPPSRIHADAGSFADDILSRLDSVLFEIGISPSWIEPRRPVGGGIDTIDVRVPSDLPVPSVNRQLTQFILWHGGHIVRGQERQGPAVVDLAFGIDSTVTTIFRLRRDRRLARRTGDIAIVIDVDGAPAAYLRRLARLAQPLTLAATGEAADLVRRLADGEHQLIGAIPEATPRLDADSLNAADVARRLWALAEEAADEGQAVASARLLPATLEAFEEMLPGLERRGYRFVTLAELDP